MAPRAARSRLLRGRSHARGSRACVPAGTRSTPAAPARAYWLWAASQAPSEHGAAVRMRLSGRVVLITGAARGIGAHTARVVAARGARVALVGLEPERLSALADELGPGHVWFACDVTDQAAVDAAIAGTVERLGGIDVV